MYTNMILVCTKTSAYELITLIESNIFIYRFFVFIIFLTNLHKDNYRIFQYILLHTINEKFIFII